MTQRLTPPLAGVKTGIDTPAVKRRAYLAYFAFVVVGSAVLGLALPAFDAATAAAATAIAPPRCSSSAPVWWRSRFGPVCFGSSRWCSTSPTTRS